MKSVTISDTNYQIAQQRAETYQKNLIYAQKNVERLDKEQAKLQQLQIARGGQIFKKLKEIYQLAGLATATPVVRVVVTQDGWNKLSKSDQISLTIYAQSLIPAIKAAPTKDYGLNKTGNHNT